MQLTYILKVVARREHFTINEGSINIRLLSENNHKINLIACDDVISNKGDVFFCRSFVTLPRERE